MLKWGRRRNTSAHAQSATMQKQTREPENFLGLGARQAVSSQVISRHLVLMIHTRSELPVTH